MKRKLTRISKFLSVVLRHQPQHIGLTVDPAGWADVSELLAKANEAGNTFFRSANGVWLTDHVPIIYIQFPDDSR